MYKNPLIIGVGQQKAGQNIVALDQVMLDLGRNTGNMMFTEALLRVLDGTILGSFSLSPYEIEGHDAIVLAAANWINQFEDFGWLAERLEAVNLPVFLIGIGAQAASSDEAMTIPAGTRRLLDIVSERSKSIATRGNYSSKILEQNGYRKVHTTGCPSLMLIGRDGPKIKEHGEKTLAAVTMHSTRHDFSRTTEFQAFLYRQALKHDVDLLLQSENLDMYYAIGSQVPDELREKAADTLSVTYGSEEGEIIRYLRRRGKVFANFDDWISYMAGQTFCVGTRFHGTIAALIAGTPATLINHDSRTAEMSEAMSIPHLSCEAIDTSSNLDLHALHSHEKIQIFSSNYQKYRNEFLNFFSENSLPVRKEHLA